MVLLWFGFVLSPGDLMGRCFRFLFWVCWFGSVLDWKIGRKEANLQSKGARKVAIFALKVGDNELQFSVPRRFASVLWRPRTSCYILFFCHAIQISNAVSSFVLLHITYTPDYKRQVSQFAEQRGQISGDLCIEGWRQRTRTCSSPCRVDSSVLWRPRTRCYIYFFFLLLLNLKLWFNYF